MYKVHLQSSDNDIQRTNAIGYFSCQPIEQYSRIFDVTCTNEIVLFLACKEA